MTAVLGTLLGGCGRTAPHTSAVDGGSRVDGRFAVPDGSLRRDGRPRGDGLVGFPDARPPDGPTVIDAGVPDAPCDPDCVELCAFAVDKCGLPLPSASCLALCQGLSAAQRACLAGAYCGLAGADPCAAAQQCLEQPPPGMPDLALVAFTAAVTGTTVIYRLTACNLGGAATPGFFVDLYYDRPTAPAIADYGDQYQQRQGLLPGTCGELTFTRTGTPLGAHASWAQIDADAGIDEANEANNVAGPLTVAVSATPAGADLVIQAFSHQLTSPTRVRYRVQVCNVGSGPAAATQVHVYYDRAVAPGVGDLGDQARAVPGLAPGACATRSISRPGTPPGSYQSWAQVDAGGVVPELDEGNNVGGPTLVTVGQPPGDCSTTCAFATSCGIFAGDELLRCATWCAGLTLAQRACLDAAIKAGSCADFKSCNTPPPPPPPPPPGVCPELCDFLINDCSLLPAAQYWTCIGVCQSAPPDRINCALQAKSNNQCMQTVTCLL